MPHQTSSFLLSPETKDDLENIKLFTKNCIKFCHMFQDIIDAYLSDYFTKQHEYLVPRKWWQEMCKMEPTEFAALLDERVNAPRRVWPLGLLAFHQTSQTLSLKRKPVHSVKTAVSEGLCTRAPDLTCNKVEAKDSVDPGFVTNGQYLTLEHCFRKHVKPKKQHEITKLGEAVAKLGQVCSCKNVVDVGSGQGHLSRLLAFGYGLDVTTVEAMDCHAPRAEKFDREVQLDIEKGRIISRKKKKLRGTIPHAESKKQRSFTAPNHVVARIDPNSSVDTFLGEIKLARRRKWDNSCEKGDSNLTVSNVTAASTFVTRNGIHQDLTDDECSTERNNLDTVQDLSNKSGSEGLCCKSLQMSLQADMTNTNYPCSSLSVSNARTTTGCQHYSQHKENQVPPFILTGLHACGDLSSTMLRVFVQCPGAVGLASVACCYMKLSTGTKGRADGYPMSQYVQSLDHTLSWEAREMACHCVDTYKKRLQDNSPHLVCHSYRAALQEVVLDKDPSIQHGCIRLIIKNVTHLTFQQYAEKALPKLGLTSDLSEMQIERGESRLKLWKDIVAFFTLRLCLAPVVETIILLDRMLFLYEHGLASCLIPVFDPELSPRNFVLIAKK